MKATNIEIKARARGLEGLEQMLVDRGAKRIGEDHQVDTYFEVARGRLKWRRGTIENALIHYSRDDQSGPKHSRVHLVLNPSREVLALVSAALPVRCVVDKRRVILFLDNVKVHLDRVEGLGSFLEIEAIDRDGSRTLAELENQCRSLMAILGVRDQDLMTSSYSDMLAAETK